MQYILIIVILIGSIGCNVNREEIDIGLEACKDNLGISTISCDPISDVKYTCKDGTIIWIDAAREALKNPNKGDTNDR